MKIVDKIAEAVIETTTDAIFKAEKKSPEILIGTGIAAGIGAAVLACKATLRADEVLDEVKEDIENVREASEIAAENENVTYDEKDKARDLAIVYSRGVVKIVGLYWKPVVLGLISIGLILKGHNILQKRHIALLAAYSSLEKNYDKLYTRVEREFGKETAEKFRNGMSERSVEVTEEDPETGKTKKKKRKENFVDDIEALGPDTYLFGPHSTLCDTWFAGDINLNYAYLRGQESNAEFKIASKPSHVLMLSDIFNDMKATEIPMEAYSRGWRRPKDWTKKTAAAYINWTIKEVWHVYDETEGPRKCLLVNFNCDGNVLSDIPTKKEMDQ